MFFSSYYTLQEHRRTIIKNDFMLPLYFMLIKILEKFLKKTKSCKTPAKPLMHTSTHTHTHIYYVVFEFPSHAASQLFNMRKAHERRSYHVNRGFAKICREKCHDFQEERCTKAFFTNINIIMEMTVFNNESRIRKITLKRY